MPYKGIDWDKEFPNVLEMGKAGISLKEIGDKYGITRERVRQQYKKYGVDPRSVGVALRTRLSREERARMWFDKNGDKEQLLYAVKRKKFTTKRANAKRVGIPFSITFGELEWPTHCPVLGLELDYEAGYRQDTSVSFDRIDETRGYEKGNVVLVSFRANRIKNNGTVEEHQKIVDFYKKF